MSYHARPSTDPSIELLEILRSEESADQRRLASVLPKVPVALFCGADNGIEWDERRPCRIQVVPDEETSPPRKRQRRSNGCGTRVHGEAYPDKRWTGLPDGVSRDVIHLGDEYFSSSAKRELMLGKGRCECTRTGMGCAICGNPLGAFFRPCERHFSLLSHSSMLSQQHYVFLGSAVSPPLPSPAQRISTRYDGIQFDFDAPRRRTREGDDIQRLRASTRVQQLSQTQTPLTVEDVSARRPEDEDAVRVPLSRFFTWRNSQNRHSPPPPPLSTIPVGDPTLSGRAFEVWADQLIEGANAIAATGIPIDLNSVGETPRQSSRTDAPPRPDTPEWWRELRNGIVSPSQRPAAHDWPPVIRSFERSTAALSDSPASSSSEETQDVVGPEEQEKEEPIERNLFER
ncbi:hypothetical protein C8F01DRAFT_1251101 [Mycena amicta]|nr:hypothetical protein C8F01DRAFT_1251101 [Mycena amicta]